MPRLPVLSGPNNSTLTLIVRENEIPLTIPLFSENSPCPIRFVVPYTSSDSGPIYSFDTDR